MPSFAGLQRDDPQQFDNLVDFLSQLR
jgi:hypothetical protein